MKVFVYGTLKQGYCNHWFLRDAVEIVPAKVWGRIYDGWFPTAQVPEKSILANGTYNHLVDSQTQDSTVIDTEFKKPKGNWGIIHGELATLRRPEDMESLDRLEGFRVDDDRCLYKRSLVKVMTEDGLETAWIYWSKRASERGELLLSGVWENESARRP